MRTFFAALLGGIFSLGIYHVFVQNDAQVSESEAAPIFRTANMGAAALVPSENVDFVNAAKMSVDAVVHVKTTYLPKQQYNPWSQFFGGERYYSQEQKAAGSGVIISGDGYIVTNNHVVANAKEIEVVTNDNRTYIATLIGTDPATDLALLKIDEASLPAIVLGDSDFLNVGEWVLAVGNPFNLTSTVTAGIVSAKARNINILGYDPQKEVFPLESFIQTDAAVNPGNSGGALVNSRGELVGINTAIASQTGSYSGYSFAIPVSIVKKVMADLIEFGKVERAYIGVNISNLDPTVVLENELKISEGAFVRGLISGGAASDAGIKEGDVITSVDDRMIRNVTELQEQIGKFRPGDMVSVGLLRKGNQKKVEVILRDRYGNKSVEKQTAVETNSIFGASLGKITPEEKTRLQIGNGVKITEIDNGKLMQAGLKKGFIITHIDKEAVESPEQVYEIMRSKRGGILLEGVHQNGMPDYYGFGL